MRQHLIGAGFSLLGSSGLHRWVAPSLRGLGAILMFHHVRPYRAQAFEPNRALEITPEFLEAVIVRLRRLGYAVVSLDEAVAAIGGHGRPAAPFAALTFDDGYRDTVEHALPVLEKHAAPFTMFVTAGFAAREAGLWWVELEDAIRRSDRLEIEIGGELLRLPARTSPEKQAAFDAIYWRLRSGSETRLLDTVAELCFKAGVDGKPIVSDLCLTWDGIGEVARHPLATVGAHTLTHPRLAKLAEEDMLSEMRESRAAIEARIGRPVAHFAYPVGDATSAGAREFEAARACGFASAVTTRPGLVYPDHAATPTALPRLSVNGQWQDLRHIEVLLSGLAFALWNRGRRVNAA